MVAESAPALVVVGESDGGGLALLSTLVLGPRGGSEAANGASPIEGPGPHALRLDTKYYTVDVAATVHTLPDDDAAGDEAFGERPEAVVAVFDPTRDGSFARVTGWCEARDDSWSPEIRLLVCRYPTKGAMDAESASSADAADDWAVDNGYEAVAVIASGGDDDDALDEEDGLPKVVVRLVLFMDKCCGEDQPRVALLQDGIPNGEEEEKEDQRHAEWPDTDEDPGVQSDRTKVLVDVLIAHDSEVGA